MANIGPTELILVLVIALLVLGPKRLPGAARAMGQGIREFKDSIAGRDPASDDQPAIGRDVGRSVDQQPTTRPGPQSSN